MEKGLNIMLAVTLLHINWSIYYIKVIFSSSF